jgi:hypothetical protein
MARAIHARMPYSELQELRIRALEADGAAVKSDISLLRERFGAFDGKLDSILSAVGEGCGTQGAFSTPAPSFPLKTRAPAAMCNGAKDRPKITTWFEQFGAYASLLHLTPDTVVDHASL